MCGFQDGGEVAEHFAGGVKGFAVLGGVGQEHGVVFVVAAHDALLWGEAVVEGALGAFVEGSGVGELVGGNRVGFWWVWCWLDHRCNSSCFKKEGHPNSLPSEGGGHAQVGRPAHEEPGAYEAPCA